MDHVLGVDIGTSACKAVVIDHPGASVAAASDSYAFQAPQPEWAEQDTSTWWRGARQAIPRVLEAAGIGPEDVAAVGVTGQMHSAVLLDQHLEVIRPPLLWCDQRPVAEAAMANADLPALGEITLNPLLPAFTLAKLLWSRAHEPEAFGRIRHVLLSKDLLRLRLTGALATDPSDAAGTGMFDARSWAWSEPILDRFGITATWLPPVAPSASLAGRVTREAATAFGLREGTPVITGGGDQAAQALGLGAVDERVLVVQVGTSGVVVAAAREPLAGAFCHAVPERWIRLDSMHAAGNSLVWIRDVVAPGEDLAEVLAAAEGAGPGADGLLFLPFLMGERAGFGASTPAALIGLNPGHGRAHFVRAVLEGVAFELRRMRDRWYPADGGPTEVRVVGGGARNELWLRVMADAFALPMTRLERDSAYGAAVLAGIGLGWWSAAPEPSGLTAVQPDPAGARALADAYRRYLASYAALGGLADHAGASA